MNDNVVPYGIFKMYKRCQQAGSRDYKDWFRQHGVKPVKAKPLNLAKYIKIEIDDLRARIMDPAIRDTEAAMYFASAEYFLTKKYILTELLGKLHPYTKEGILSAALVDHDHRVRQLASEISEAG